METRSTSDGARPRGVAGARHTHVNGRGPCALARRLREAVTDWLRLPGGANVVPVSRLEEARARRERATALSEDLQGESVDSEVDPSTWTGTHEI